MKKITKLLLGGALLTVSHFSNAGLITINVTDEGGLSESQFSIFQAANDIWSSVLTGIQSEFDLILDIAASGVAIDGQYGTLGQAAPTMAVVDNDLGYAYASAGIMQFDTADLDYMESNGTLFDVILHEMAHVIGFGTLWDTTQYGAAFANTQNVYDEDSGEYTGAYALAVYQAEIDPDALFVPVELDGGAGTANGHWDEAWGGGTSELMTGYLEGTTYLSDITIASFADIGYTTIVTHGLESTSSIDVPAPASLSLLGLGLFGLMTARRKKEGRLLG